MTPNESPPVSDSIAAEGEVRPVQDRSHLRDSRPIRWDREAASARANVALDLLLEDLEAWEPGRVRRRRQADRGHLRAILEAITLELWQALRETPTQWLAYHRGDAGYVGSDRYRHPEATKTTVKLVADFLTEAGFAEGRLGSYRQEDHGFGKSGRGYLSRLRGTDGLLAWADSYDLSGDDVALNERFELIRLKGAAETRGGRKPLLTYKDTPATNDMRDRLQAWIEMMARHQVTLGGASDARGEERSFQLSAMAQEEEAEPMERGLNGPCRLYRVFNDARWDRGGRFYGGWWMGLSRADRGRLLFNGEETVELDFSSLHPRLCYELNGTPLAAGDDPYSIPGVPDDLRDVVKVAVLQLLNAKPDKQRLGMPKGAKAKLGRRLSYAALVAKLEARHTSIPYWALRNTVAEDADSWGGPDGARATPLEALGVPEPLPRTVAFRPTPTGGLSRALIRICRSG